MPLSVGNQWTFRYYTRAWDFSPTTVIDSGLALYEIVAVSPQPDSLLWTFTEHRWIRRCHTDWQYVTTCGFIDDSTTFQLIEQRSGLHRLFRQESEDAIWGSVFPWSCESADSASVHRYAPVDSAGIAVIAPQHADSFSSRTYEYTLVQGGGLTRTVCETGPFIIGVEFHSDHALLSSVISGVEDGAGRDLPAGFALGQNYPNPFNSSTTIAIRVAAPSHVRLRLYDILGRIVATLLDEALPPGSRQVSWDASRLASGVYFYRLDGGGVDLVKRAILLR
jgi:hypothetical protein